MTDRPLDESETRNRVGAENPVAALENHRLGVLQLESERTLDPDHERCACPGGLAAWRAKAFGDGAAGVVRADNVPPAGQQLPLREAEPPERASAGTSKQLADRPRKTPPLGGPFARLRALCHRPVVCQSGRVPVETLRAEPDLLPFRLLRWYDLNARSLPWRLPPGSGVKPDPYRVWLAEVMLQQTTVEAATGPFLRFIARWPTVEALADEDPNVVMAAWSGLGYYARARNLVACARAVAATGGRFPETEQELRRLPGIGSYTAAAVAAIAFGAATVPVDANLARVGARLFGLESLGPVLVREAGEALQPFVPPDRPGDFAQALMDLGATICRPRAPLCRSCPLADCCVARLDGRSDQLPVRKARRPRPRRFGTTWWVEADGRVALVRRPPHGLLGGLLGLPGSPWGETDTPDLPFPGDWRWAPTPVVHGFTHFELHLGVAVIRLDARREFAERLVWTEHDRIEGLPTLFRKAVAVARPVAQSSGAR